MRPRTGTGFTPVPLVAVALLWAAGCTSEPAPPAPGPVAPASTTATAAPSPAGTPTPQPTPAASASTMPTGAPGVPRGLPTAAVDTASVDAVAAAFTTATFTYDTAGDVSEFDAQLRSAVYATPAFAAELTVPLARTGSAVFTELAAHDGFTTVQLVANRDDGQPPDELRTGARSYDVTVTGQGGSDGWSAVLTEDTIYVFLTRGGASAPWQVASVSFGLGR